MKRFFYAFVAVVAAFSFAACEKENTESAGKGLSFYATIDSGESRIAMSQSGEVWNSAWEGDESLTVTPNFESYFVFTNTTAEPNKFSCTMAGVEALKGAEKVYVFNSNALNSVNSALGADGMFLYAESAWKENIALTASSAMLHFDSEYFVTFEGKDMFGDGNSGRLSEITVAAGTSVFVPIFAGNTTLSYSIGGKLCKSMELEAKAGVVYELGTLVPGTDTPTPDPTPDPAGGVVYLVPNADWAQGGAWFAAYYWGGAGDGSVKLTDENSDGIYEGNIPATATGMLFCRMNPAYADFAWNSDTETDHVWNQTGDLTPGVAPNNYFYITGWDTGEWNAAGYVPEVPAQSFSLAGSFNGWSNLVMTYSGGIYSAKGVAMAAKDEFKVKDTSTWDISYGGGVATLNPNHYMKVYANGANIMIAEAGTYDVYFDLEQLNLYVVTAGTDYTTVPLQGEGGSGGGGTSSTWSISGEMNSWGDTVMEATSTANLFVAKGITTTTEYCKFKVRKDGNWTVNYGGAFSFFESNKFMTAWSQGQDMHIITPGTYDIYFQYIDDNEGKVYLLTAGTDYTVAVEQTGEGPAPALSTVSFGIVGTHNGWSAPDVKMSYNSSVSAYVATNVALSGEFKIRGNESWGAYNYGAEASGAVTVGKSIKVKNGSNTNLTVAAGTYDVYFSYDKNLVWVMTPGQVPADL
ncbi:MAG: hypothetical protein IIX34_03005 [Alistipes sp.]|nr:hypothetical protein [Alistipes sp.]